MWTEVIVAMAQIRKKIKILFPPFVLQPRERGLNHIIQRYFSECIVSCSGNQFDKIFGTEANQQDSLSAPLTQFHSFTLSFYEFSIPGDS